jgi:hypothetical protein
MILAYGLCSMFGLFYSAAHTVIPFILLGIGIDNIFVITQVYKWSFVTTQVYKWSFVTTQVYKWSFVTTQVYKWS